MLKKTELQKTDFTKVAQSYGPDCKYTSRPKPTFRRRSLKFETHDTNAPMSLASKATLLAVTLASASTIYFVHHYQASEKAVLPLSRETG